MPLEELVKILTSDMTSNESRLAVKLFTRLAWRVILMLFIAYAMGWLSVMGFVGFARADEVDKKIAVAMTPVQTTLAGLVAQSKAQEAAVKEQTLQSLRQNMLELQTKKCKSPKAETAALYRELLQNAETRYYTLTQTYYTIPNCGDL